MLSIARSIIGVLEEKMRVLGCFATAKKGQSGIEKFENVSIKIMRKFLEIKTR
jgi:hypothetical protein